MKYTDRKKTPLKWHHFLLYFGLPLLAVLDAYKLLGLINELFGLRMAGLTVALKPVLEAYGANISNLGGCFWYVVAYFVVRVMMMILIFYTWIGMLKWKEEAKKGYLYYLLIRTIEIGFLAYGAFSMYRNANSTFVKLYSGYLSYNGVRTVRFSSSVLLAFLMLSFVAVVLYTILNMVYYRKRKMLFTETYVQPEYAGMINPINEETPDALKTPAAAGNVEEATTKQVTTQEEQIPAKEADNVSVEASANEEKNAVADNVADTETPTEPVEMKEQASQETVIKFCPNCGAELGENDAIFCTHCGAKLR